MAGKVLDLESLVSPDRLASEISNKWHEWDALRAGWKQEKQELRNYVFATDTRTTTNKKLPWANSTTVPKITQIYDNLKANYLAALFPNAKWLKWSGSDMSSGMLQKREVIQGYMETKLRQSEFAFSADRLIDDYILYGNCFGTVEWVEDISELDTGEEIVTYIGPRAVRISPLDIVFNPVASNFRDTPKIVRSIVSLGEIRKKIQKGATEYEQVFDKIMTNRRTAGSVVNVQKADAFIADGFSSIQHYYGSGYVEVLTFFGDIYDMHSGLLLENHRIEIVDRAYVISQTRVASWLGVEPIYMAGWRSRPDNLYAMGPLDNLVGMQYRIDHLENLKADVFDQIAVPILKIRGDVQDFEYGPGARIYLGEEGDVAPMPPDGTALNADNQVALYEMKMEEMAGAPRQAMGIRTPGEKTAFEIQTLENASGRIFQHKASKIEAEFFQPLINAMLESARRNLDRADTIRMMDDELNVEIFEQITREDIKGNGKLWPIGASHFAERAQRIQNLQSLMQFRGDPGVAPHLSGKKVAEILAMELREKGLFGVNIAVQEQLETQQASQEAEVQNVTDLETAMEQGI